MSKTVYLFALLMASSTVFAQTNPQSAAMPSANANSQGPALSDGQIVKIMKTVNDCEIDAAKKAQGKTKNAEVKAFAAHMIAEHKQNEDDLKSFANKNSIDAMESDTDKSVKQSGKAAFSELKKADKGAFDKTYVDGQIAMHESALNLLNTQLIPSAKNAELKSRLEKTREAVTAHLDSAKELQAKLQ